LTAHLNHKENTRVSFPILNRLSRKLVTAVRSR
jgi:hypothetical protein